MAQNEFGMTTRVLKNIRIIFFLIALVVASSTPSLSAFDKWDELDELDSHGVSILQHDTNVPVGFYDDEVHHLLLPTGTPINEISEAIRQKRRAIGLSPEILISEKDQFFQFPWQVARNKVLEAFMPAMLIKLYVKEGDEIEKGTPLLVMESMKMQHIIQAKEDGKIKHILYKVSDFIEGGATLIKFLPRAGGWESLSPEIIERLLSLFPWTRGSSVEIPPDSPPSIPEGNDRNEVQQQEVEEKQPLVESPANASELLETRPIQHATTLISQEIIPLGRKSSETLPNFTPLGTTHILSGSPHDLPPIHGKEKLMDEAFEPLLRSLTRTATISKTVFSLGETPGTAFVARPLEKKDRCMTHQSEKFSLETWIQRMGGLIILYQLISILARSRREKFYPLPPARAADFRCISLRVASNDNTQVILKRA